MQESLEKFREIRKMETTDIQNIPLAELKKMVDSTTMIPVEVQADISEELVTDDEIAIQNLSMSELIEMTSKAISIIPLKEKMQKTGLSEKAIKMVETNKYRATLADILAYCKGLNIRFKDFVPEFFV